MAAYDLLMLVILVGLTLYGYFKGMAWQIAYVASFVASYFVAVRFADQLAPKITFVGPPANKFAAMAIIYAVTSLAVWMVFRLVRGAIDRVKMEGFDHQMGAIIGFGRGALWCTAVTFFGVTLLPEGMKQHIVNTQAGYYIARVLDKTDSIIPPEFHEVVGPYLNRLGSELEGAQPPAPGSGIAWPSGSSPTAPQAAPSWGQQAPAQLPAAPGWPTPQPATQPPASNPPAWPQANAAPAAPSTNDFGWPTNNPGGQATPAAQVSWPEWD